MNRFLPVSLTLFFASSVVASQSPNVLFIAVDDLVPRLGVYGDTIAQSPRIDSLASQGTTFLHAQTQYPVCGPARASIMSGLRPESVGVLDLETKWRDASPGLISLPQYLKDSHGYFTTGTGKILDYRNVEDPDTMDAESWSESFDDSPGTSPNDVEKQGQAAATAPYVNLVTAAPVDPLENFPDYRIAQVGIDRMRERAAAGQPFFLAVGFKKPHLPFFAPDEYWALYNRNDFTIHPFQDRAADNSGYGYGNSFEIRNYEPIPQDHNLVPGSAFSEALQKELIHGYYACVSYIDALVGMLVDELEALQIEDNTIIVLWGDHGFHLGDHGQWAKNTPFEQAARVPLIIVDPRKSNQVATTTAPAELTDIYPTLCELLGVPLPNFLEGTSLVPALEDPAAKPREGAVTLRQVSDTIGYSIRNERYRYIEWISEIDKTVVGRDLFDYLTDPYETQNLVNDPTYAATLDTMTDMLHNDTAGLLLLEESLAPKLDHTVPDQVSWGYKGSLEVTLDPKDEVLASLAIYLNDELKYNGADTAVTLENFYAYLPAESSHDLRIEVDFVSGVQLDDRKDLSSGCRKHHH
jgi:iduronate 2-sulfatase